MPAAMIATLLSFWSPNDKTELAHHMAYDACRKPLKFLTRKNT